MDQRYIRINGKPLFLVYRTELLPNPAKTAEIWREAAYKARVGEIYLARVESFTNTVDPKSIGFDAAVEFAPDWRNMGKLKGRSRLDRWLVRMGIIPKFYMENSVVDYQNMVQTILGKPEPNFTWLRCVTPSFDNSARRPKNAAVFHGSAPEKYEDWLRQVIMRTRKKLHGDERIVFINAWNEWGEGNHLEPDLKWGRGYLEATRRAIQGHKIENE